MARVSGRTLYWRAAIRSLSRRLEVAWDVFAHRCLSPSSDAWPLPSHTLQIGPSHLL
jgi:hypothetical protein